MNASPPAVATRLELRLAWMAFVAALFLYYLTVLRVDYPATDLFDLHPTPDAIEYHALANALLESGRADIRIGENSLPSRYPAGWPTLTLPWLVALGKEAGIQAPFRTNQTIGLLLLGGLFFWYWSRGRPIRAAAAALLLATLPAFASLARSSLSELASGALILLSFGLLMDGSRRESLPRVLLAACLLGLAVNLRLQLLLFAPALLTVLLMGSHPPTRRLLNGSLALGAYLLGAAPTLLLNHAAFGHPLHTGYHLWTPEFMKPGATFALRHIPHHLSILLDECLGRGGFKVTHLSGSGSYFIPSFILLAALAPIPRRIDRSLLGVLLGVAAFAGGTLLYYFDQDSRLYVPLLFLLIPLAASAVEYAWMRRHQKDTRLRVGAVAVLGIACLLGFPGGVGYPLRPVSFVSIHSIRWPDKKNTPVNYNALHAFAHHTSGRPALLLSDLSPVYASTLLPHGSFAAPVDGHHEYNGSNQWRYDRPEAYALVTDMLERGLAIYALQLASTPEQSVIERVPHLSGHAWTPVIPSPPGILLWELRSLPPSPWREANH